MWERSCFWLNLNSFLTIMHKSGVGSVSLVSSRSKETLDYMLKICFCRFTFRENLRATESSKSKSLEGPKAKNSPSPSRDLK